MDNKKLQKKQSKKSGFTLVEIILVVAILGVLMSIVLPSFTGRGKDAQIAKTKATIRTLSAAIQLYEIENSKFPKTLDELINNKKNKVYLEKKAIPKDPWGNAFQYTVPGTHNTHSYDLWTDVEGESINNWDVDDASE